MKGTATIYEKEPIKKYDFFHISQKYIELN